MTDKLSALLDKARVPNQHGPVRWCARLPEPAAKFLAMVMEARDNGDHITGSRVLEILKNDLGIENAEQQKVNNHLNRRCQCFK